MRGAIVMSGLIGPFLFEPVRRQAPAKENSRSHP
jgi:hypothetical protein